jgi:hypothetical protein
MFILNLGLENDLHIKIISNKCNKPIGKDLQISVSNKVHLKYLIYDKQIKEKLNIYEIKEHGKIIEKIKEIDVPVEFMSNRIEYLGDDSIVMIDYI